MGAGGRLLERDDFVASGAKLVDLVGSGGAGALFLIGEAGLGKTSVLDRVCQDAAGAGLAVGVGRGHPMENGLPFGVLVRALDAVGGRGLLGEDAAGSRSAADWPAHYYRVLRWLQNRAGDPLFLAIDDLHWADADSVALVSFLCRRMDQVPLGLIASLRPWPTKAHETAARLVDEGHGDVLRLLPLSEQAAGSLLDARLGRPVPAPARRQAFELSAGNPLLLEQLAVAMGDGADVPAATGISVAASGNGMLLSRFAGLSDSGMRCAQAAAVLGVGFLPAIAAEVAGLDGAKADAAIEALARTGLVVQRPGAAAEFVHPLFRQALYDDVPGPLRCRLHARAFTVLHARGLDRQAAEHAIPGALSGDPDAVAVLEAAGRAARRTGAMATAVSWLDKAVTTAGERASVRLLMDRAEAHLVTGGAATAAGAYEMLLARDDLDSGTRLEIVWMLARAQATAGQQDTAAATFERAAALAAGSDPATAVQILLDAAYCAWLAGGATPAMDLASRARDLAGPAGEAAQARADASWAEYAVSCASPDGIAAAEAAVASWAAGNLPLNVEKTVRRGGWGTANSLASCALGLERLTVADSAYSIVRAAAEDAGVPWAASGLAVGHTYTLFRMGRLDHALTAARAAVSLAELVPLIDAYANAALAYISLYAGLLDESARLARHAEAVAAERGHLLAQMFLCDTLGHRRLREGAIAEACAAYDRLEDIHARTGIQEPCLPAWPRHAINAYLAAGRTTDAQRVLAWLDEITPRLPCAFPRIAAAACRASLAELNRDYAAAEAHYRSALTLHSRAGLPVEYCETLLAYGAFLRQAGQAGRARSVLAQAAHVAGQAGASWLAGLAHEELKTAGGRLRRPRTGPPALSTQEERVTALVARGMTNAAIARQLSLSVSTIETHLERIYAKLGIHSRYQLIAMRAAEGQAQP